MWCEIEKGQLTDFLDDNSENSDQKSAELLFEHFQSNYAEVNLIKCK